MKSSLATPGATDPKWLSSTLSAKSSFRYCAESRFATSFSLNGSLSDAAIWFTKTDLLLSMPVTMSFRQRVSGFVISVAEERYPLSLVSILFVSILSMELFFRSELFVFSYYNLRLLKQFSYLKTSRNTNELPRCKHTRYQIPKKTNPKFQKKEKRCKHRRIKP